LLKSDNDDDDDDYDDGNFYCFILFSGISKTLQLPNYSHRDRCNHWAVFSTIVAIVAILSIKWYPGFDT
jgi:hypothetical protein